MNVNIAILILAPREYVWMAWTLLCGFMLKVHNSALVARSYVNFFEAIVCFDFKYSPHNSPFLPAITHLIVIVNPLGADGIVITIGISPEASLDATDSAFVVILMAFTV